MRALAAGYIGLPQCGERHDRAAPCSWLQEERDTEHGGGTFEVAGAQTLQPKEGRSYFYGRRLSKLHVHHELWVESCFVKILVLYWTITAMNLVKRSIRSYL